MRGCSRRELSEKRRNVQPAEAEGRAHAQAAAQCAALLLHGFRQCLQALEQLHGLSRQALPFRRETEPVRAAHGKIQPELCLQPLQARRQGRRGDAQRTRRGAQRTRLGELGYEPKVLDLDH